MIRSVLGHILPEAMVCYLENYSAEKFAEIFLGEFDTPEAIWNSEMRWECWNNVAVSKARKNTRHASYTNRHYHKTARLTHHLDVRKKRDCFINCSDSFMFFLTWQCYVWCRRMMIEKIASHLADFSPRLQSNTRALYQYCPIPIVNYPQLENELFCNIYYLKHLCDTTRFPDWPVRDPVSCPCTHSVRRLCSLL